VLSLVQQLTGTLVGADVVEYNPRQDLGGVTAVVAAKIVKEIAGRILAENSQGVRPGDRRPG
jgi:arginase